jgi:hypothetical protein
MSIEIIGVDSNFSLKDAIAYEFFMENVGKFIEEHDSTADEFIEFISVLAKSSFLVAEIFADTRKNYKARITKETNDKV